MGSSPTGRVLSHNINNARNNRKWTKIAGELKDKKYNNEVKDEGN